ncbi:MAG: GGDEF domain-containing protein [Rhodoferax sp.]|uniref:GGDEF domain-containing protein n=1 Tax=Rhodoferax sp. TaxID=50421 RepID=UPI001B4AB0B4|nr:GGDEF domain-containing protein [Rhodoferax sp.]MBP9903927.1 GGDEF domain-containing protein [Rhodoferax sp.]
MHALITDIRRRAALWRLEHTQVALSAQRANLQRASLVAPLIASFNLVFVIWLGAELLLQQDSEIVTQWKLGLFLTHLTMGLSFALLGWLARGVGDAVNSLWARSLPVLVAALALFFVIGFCTFDQWVTPNMTPFVIGAMSIGLVVYLRPVTAAWLFVLAYVLFFVAIGSTQANAQQLLSNRINGFAAAGLGWALSLILWRKFTTIVLQQAQLENANAELQLKQRELQRMTRLDGLTGLYNRSTFAELARQELARAQRQSSSTTILLLDLDYFKRVNDTWGHPAGDAVLKNVAVVANNTVRATDLVGRLGGEEFIILLPNTSLEAARRLAEKLRANLEHSSVVWEKSAIHTTVSIGVASTSAAENLDFDHLYTVADKALYIAKEKGRNRVI